MLYITFFCLSTFDQHLSLSLSGCPQCHPDLNALLTFANKRCHTKKCNFDSSYLCQTLPVAKFQPNMSPAGVWLVGPVHLLELIHLVLLAHQHPVQQKNVRFTICFFFFGFTIMYRNSPLQSNQQNSWLSTVFPTPSMPHVTFFDYRLLTNMSRQ